MPDKPHIADALLALLLITGALALGAGLRAVFPATPPDCGYLAQKLTEGFAMGPGDWRDFHECQSVEGP